MAVVIGAAEPGFNDPVGLLQACHRRIERFLHALCQITRNRMGGQLSRAEAEALEVALTYFRTAAPHHTEDEEFGLFPALSCVQSESADLDRLQQEHRRAEQLHAEVDEIGLSWLRDGTLDDGFGARLLAALESLNDLYREHIRIEEEEVFPRASVRLSQDVLESIGRDMAARRGAVYIANATVSIGGGTHP